MNIYKTLFLLIIALGLQTSCKKESAEEDTPLIVGTWQVTKIEVSTNNSSYIDDVASKCKLDDLEEYSENGSWVLYDGSLACSSGNGITRGRWKLTANNKKLIYTYDIAAGEYESTVEELTERRLVLSHSVGTTTPKAYRTTYEKQ